MKAFLYKFIIFLIFLFPLSVVASTGFFSISSDTELYKILTLQTPSVNEDVEAYLGDNIVVTQTGAWKECITPVQTYYAKESGRSMLYKEKEPLCKLSPKDKAYFPSYDNYTFYGPKPIPVTWKPKKNKSKLCAENGWACAKKLPENAVIEEYSFVPTEPMKSIEYAGKKANVLSFIFSIKDPVKNETKTRDIDLDLSEGNILAYKGLLIEVIESTNMSIKYKILRSFK